MRNNETLPLCIFEYQSIDKHYQILYYDINNDIKETIYKEKININNNNNKTTSSEKNNTDKKEISSHKIVNLDKYQNNDAENNIISDLNNLKFEFNDNNQIKNIKNIEININLLNNIPNINNNDYSKTLNDFKIEKTKNILNSLISILKDEYSNLEEINKNNINELPKGDDYPLYPFLC